MTSTGGRHNSEYDPLLDSLLDEAVGGRRPPDLKPQILDEYRAVRATESKTSAGSSENAISVASGVEPTAAPAQRSGSESRMALPGWSIALAACLVGILITSLLFWRSSPTDRDTPMAVRDDSRRADSPPPRQPDAPLDRARRSTDGSPSNGRRPDPAIDVRATPDRTTPDRTVSVPREDRTHEPVAVESTTTAAVEPVTGHDEDEAKTLIIPTVTPREVNGSQERRSSNSSDVPIDSVLPDSRMAKLDDAPIIERINRHLANGWSRGGVAPSAVVPDEVWLDAAFVKLIGREPNSAERRDFMNQSAERRKAVVVNRLLSDAHADEFAERWSQQCTDWLLDGISGKSRTLRSGLERYLTDAFRQSRGFDQVWMEMITANGSNDPGRGDFNGATNYFLALEDGSGLTDATAQLCRTMLGQRVACAQCHDDQLRDRTQQDFWQMVATIHSANVERLRRGRGRINDVKSTDEIGVAFTNPDGTTASAAPGGFDGRLLNLSSDRSLRTQLASQLVASNEFAKASVNRFWEAFLQYGFTLPVDDLGRHNPVSHPGLVTMMSDQFVAHDYDIRQLARWIVLSDAFGRSDVVSPANAKDAPAMGTKPLFSRSYYRPTLFAEATEGLQLLANGAKPRVTQADEEATRDEILARREPDLQSDQDQDDKRRDNKKDRMGQLLPKHYVKLIRSLDDGKLTSEQQLEHAYLVVRGRQPTDAERAHADAIFKASKGNSKKALQRVFWTLLNSAR